ncbi:MAG: pyridoxamine 5'-phosphate oxidase family protein [Patescibacteria group bacterium]
MVNLNEEEVKNLIENNPIAFGTAEDNKPNVIGVAYVKVVSDDEVVITDNFMKKTKENLDKNNNVCLAVWDKDWHGYKLVGEADYHMKGKWKEFVEKMPENEGYLAKGAIVVKVNKLIKLG